MAFGKISKAVFPVAGLGSRFLPVTKASPKEMLPIVDKPLIQFAVEEAAAAGITDMIFINGRNKRAIEDHFDKAYELETELAARKKTELLDIVHGVLPRGINCIYIRQAEALGLGHAVLCAEPVIGNEPFAVLLADDLIDAKVPVLKQMTEIASREQYSLVGVIPVDQNEIGSYGIVHTAADAVPSVGEAQAGHDTIHAGSGWTLHPDTAYLPSSAHDAARCRGRDPAHRRDRAPPRRRESARLPVRGAALRLR